MKIRLRPEAESDLREARDWYAERAPGLDQRFGTVVLRALEGLREHPGQGHELADGIRRVIVPKFPYSVFYLIEGEHLEVLAVLHHARHPSHWKRRR